jgi:hypothetical protein
MYLFEHIYSYFTSHTTQQIVALVFVLCAFLSANATITSSNGDVNPNSVYSYSFKYNKLNTSAKEGVKGTPQPWYVPITYYNRRRGHINIA